MALTYTQRKVKELEGFITYGGEDLISAIVKYSAEVKGITDDMKKTNETSDKDITLLFTTLILDAKPLPGTPITYAKDTQDYPKSWVEQTRNYSLDYNYWMIQSKPQMKYFFDFLTLFADKNADLLDVIWSKVPVIGGEDREKTAILMFKNLVAMMTNSNVNKKDFFEELAKSAIISKLIYMYVAHYTSAIAIMYFDAVFGYLILSNYWTDGAIYGAKNINSVTVNVLGVEKKYENWKSDIPTFPQKSRDLIQKGYDVLESNTELSGATEYKKIRFSQLQGLASSDIQMLVAINEKFNINCDDTISTTTYRVGMANSHYKTFKITIPD